MEGNGGASSRRTNFEGLYKYDFSGCLLGLSLNLILILACNMLGCVLILFVSQKTFVFLFLFKCTHFVSLIIYSFNSAVFQRNVIQHYLC